MQPMPHDLEHPAARYDADIQKAKRRGTAAVISLALTAALRASSIPVQFWQSSLLDQMKSGSAPPQATLELSDSLFQLGGIAELVLLLVTGILFLRWLHIVVRLSRALGVNRLQWSPSQAVWGFIIPFVSFARPYRIMRDLHDLLSPDMVPEPPMQVRAGEGGYRDVQFEVPPAPAKLPHASIGAWWTAFWVGNILANFAGRQTGTTIEALLTRNTLYSVSDAVDIVSALLAVVVVRAVTARLLERFRRVRHSTAEALDREGIVLATA